MYCVTGKNYEILQEEQEILRQAVIMEILDYQNSITYKISNMSKAAVKKYLEVWDGTTLCLEYLQKIGAKVNVLFNCGDCGYRFFDIAIYSAAGKVIDAEQLPVTQQMELFINRLEYYRVKYSPEERKYLLHYAAGSGNMTDAAVRANRIMEEQYGVTYGGLSPSYKKYRQKKRAKVWDGIPLSVLPTDKIYGIVKLEHWANTRYQILNPGWEYHIYLFDGSIREVTPREYYLKNYEDALEAIQSHSDMETSFTMVSNSLNQWINEISSMHMEYCVKI